METMDNASDFFVVRRLEPEMVMSGTALATTETRLLEDEHLPKKLHKVTWKLYANPAVKYDDSRVNGDEATKLLVKYEFNEVTD